MIFWEPNVLKRRSFWLLLGLKMWKQKNIQKPGRKKRQKKRGDCAALWPAWRNAQGCRGGKRRGVRLHKSRIRMYVEACGSAKRDLEVFGEILDPRKEKSENRRRVSEKRKEIWIRKKRRARFEGGSGRSEKRSGSCGFGELRSKSNTPAHPFGGRRI